MQHLLATMVLHFRIMWYVTVHLLVYFVCHLSLNYEFLHFTDAETEWMLAFFYWNVYSKFNDENRVYDRSRNEPTALLALSCVLRRPLSAAHSYFFPDKCFSCIFSKSESHSSGSISTCKYYDRVGGTLASTSLSHQSPISCVTVTELGPQAQTRSRVMSCP